MTQMQDSSLSISFSSSKTAAIPKRRVNWHEAASCAVQIELRDYADLLACLLTAQLNSTKQDQYSALDISITFLAFRYPRKLVKHLRNHLQDTTLINRLADDYAMHKEQDIYGL